MSRCGTVRGYFDHIKAHETTCSDCRKAKRVYQEERRHRFGPCAICGQPSYARQLCTTHLDRLYQHGDPNWQRPSASERFWNKVTEGPVAVVHLGPCWLWTGSVGSKGYGKFGRGSTLAHRFAYEDMVGDIPDGLTIDHLCRVLTCVNPAHLDPVPRSINTHRQHDARRAAA